MQEKKTYQAPESLVVELDVVIMAGTNDVVNGPGVAPGGSNPGEDGPWDSEEEEYP